MAATPTSLLVLSTAQLTALASARAALDAELRLRYVVGEPVKIRHSILDELFLENPAMLDTLLAEYRTAGWTIIEYDSRDQGKWFSFFVGP